MIKKLKVKIFSVHKGVDYTDRAAGELTKLVNDWVTEKNKISVEDIKVHTQFCEFSSGLVIFFIATVKYIEEP